MPSAHCSGDQCQSGGSGGTAGQSPTSGLEWSPRAEWRSAQLGVRRGADGCPDAPGQGGRAAYHRAEPAAQGVVNVRRAAPLIPHVTRRRPSITISGTRHHTRVPTHCHWGRILSAAIGEIRGGRRTATGAHQPTRRSGIRGSVLSRVAALTCNGKWGS